MADWAGGSAMSWRGTWQARWQAASAREQGLLLLALGLDGRLSFAEGGILFVLLVSYTVFLVVQFFLSQEVTGKDKALEQLNAQIAQLNDRSSRSAAPPRSALKWTA